MNRNLSHLAKYDFIHLLWGCVHDPSSDNWGFVSFFFLSCCFHYFNKITVHALQHLLDSKAVQYCLLVNIHHINALGKNKENTITFNSAL